MHPSEASAPPLSARQQQRRPSACSSVLGRLARDVAAECVRAGADAGLLESVEAVTPRRIADFKAVTSAGADGGALRAALEAAPWVRRCVSVPPHCYFDVEPERLTDILREELCRERRFGYLPGGGDEELALAFCSPNANKPLHVGHARNLFLGGALSNLLEFGGAHVFRSLCLSDYGVHIFKAAAQYVRAGGGATPESAGMKGDHFVGGFYAAYGGAPPRAEDLSRLWMAGDPGAVELTARLVGWAEEGFRATFADWGARFHHWFRETEEQRYIDAFLAEQAERGTVRRDEEGRRVVDLDDGTQVPLLRSDGSTLYMSHMVAAILQRTEYLGPRARVLLSLTAQEQIPAFTQLAAVLRRFGYAERVEVRHLWHGLVTLDGEKMSSREGAAATLDGVYAELRAVYERRGLGALAPACARGALRLYLLERPVRKPLDFSLAACVAGGGGLVAEVARTLQITARGAEAREGAQLPRARREALAAWRMRLAGFPGVVDRAIREYDPSHVVRYLADVCGGFLALHRATAHAGAAPPELARLFLPLRRVVDEALRLLDAREVEYEMLPLEHAAAAGRRAPTLSGAGG